MSSCSTLLIKCYFWCYSIYSHYIALICSCIQISCSITDLSRLQCKCSCSICSCCICKCICLLWFARCIQIHMNRSWHIDILYFIPIISIIFRIFCWFWIFSWNYWHIWFIWIWTCSLCYNHFINFAVFYIILRNYMTCHESLNTSWCQTTKIPSISI